MASNSLHKRHGFIRFCTWGFHRVRNSENPDAFLSFWWSLFVQIHFLGSLLKLSAVPILKTRSLGKFWADNLSRDPKKWIWTKRDHQNDKKASGFSLFLTRWNPHVQNLMKPCRLWRLLDAIFAQLSREYKKALGLSVKVDDVLRLRKH
jgi:hypothetical protein